MRTLGAVAAAALIIIPGLVMAQDMPAGIGEAIGQLGQALGGASPQGTSSGELSGRAIQLFALMTVLAVAPGLLICLTSFTRFVIVFSMLRSALGLNQSPPNMVITSLALFMTFFVMQPVFTDAWEDGISPLVEGSITEEQAFQRAAEPFHRFMLANTREADLALFVRMAHEGRPGGADPAEEGADVMSAADNISGILPENRADVAWSTLIPAFMISELRRAFTIGFLIYVPFFVIDLIVAGILMGAGMMMLSPMVVSLPFKVIFFVLIDGWYKLAGSLMQSYAIY
ncbi:flagellar type III secretion system pore protein FliP [Paracoccus sp. ME4]|uniref:flagellar type III secretion system pore protein FliP n=1 Tax=Paracoccus sp. ME4 TaxID=3138066 RepID=UPI00398B80ED